MMVAFSMRKIQGGESMATQVGRSLSEIDNKVRQLDKRKNWPTNP